MADAPLILAFDTSRPACAVALLGGDEVLAAAEEPMARGQAERLMPLVEEVLASAGVTTDDLDAIAVGIGPGNFTGIRLSVAAARGLALGRGIPAIGVSTLEALALDAPRPCLVLLDARRGAVHAQRFGPDGAPELVEDPATLPDDFPRIGDGPGAVWPDLPLAVRIARAALPRLTTPQPRPAPLYLRAADAAPSRQAVPAILP